MDGNIVPEEEDKKEEIKLAMPKEGYKKDNSIEDIVMEKEPLPISKNNKEKIEEKINRQKNGQR